MSDENGYTPVQCRILATLEDGRAHHWSDLKDDPLWTMDNIKDQLSKLRKRLPPDMLIYCHRAGNGPFYQLLRLST